MKQIGVIIFYCFAVVGLPACTALYPVSRYSPANTLELRQYKGKNVFIEKVVELPNERSEILCRGGGRISTPSMETYSNYILNAFNVELKHAEVLNSSGPLKISGTTTVDFSSTDGEWKIQLALSSSNGRKSSYSEKYRYPTDFSGHMACYQTANAFMPAVQDLIGKVATSPEFKDLLEDTSNQKDLKLSTKPVPMETKPKK